MLRSIKLKEYNTKLGVSAPSGGYSTDTQQVVNQLCYNSTIILGTPQSDIKLQTSMSFEDLQTSLGVSIDVEGKFGMFSASISIYSMFAGIEAFCLVEDGHVTCSSHSDSSVA